MKNNTRVPGSTGEPTPPPQAARPVGRPPADQPPSPAQEAETVVMPDRVMPCRCPNCGRAQEPRVLRRRPTGERDCSCALCGKEFVYTPAMIRPK